MVNVPAPRGFPQDHLLEPLDRRLITLEGLPEHSDGGVMSVNVELCHAVTQFNSWHQIVKNLKCLTCLPCWLHLLNWRGGWWGRVRPGLSVAPRLHSLPNAGAMSALKRWAGATL